MEHIVPEVRLVPTSRRVNKSCDPLDVSPFLYYTRLAQVHVKSAQPCHEIVPAWSSILMWVLSSLQATRLDRRAVCTLSLAETSHGCFINVATIIIVL
jgi:hypothetical protein